jgi:hypothetical protein
MNETCQLENTILQETSQSENIITPKQENILQKRIDIDISQQESSTLRKNNFQNYNNNNNNRRNVKSKI